MFYACLRVSLRFGRKMEGWHEIWVDQAREDELKLWATRLLSSQIVKPSFCSRWGSTVKYPEHIKLDGVSK